MGSGGEACCSYPSALSGSMSLLLLLRLNTVSFHFSEITDLELLGNILIVADQVMKKWRRKFSYLRAFPVVSIVVVSNASAV